jgi:hypothetical protein
MPARVPAANLKPRIASLPPNETFWIDPRFVVVSPALEMYLRHDAVASPIENPDWIEARWVGPLLRVTLPDGVLFEPSIAELDTERMTPIDEIGSRPALAGRPGDE